MRQSKATFLVPLLIFIVTFSGAIVLQSQNIAKWRILPFRFRDSLYLPSSEYVRIVSMGYDSFVADFLWLRMIQAFASAWTVPENLDQMWKYYSVITDLDPKFEDPYTFAIMAIGEEGRRTAINTKTEKRLADIDNMIKQIVGKGVEKKYGVYKMPFDGAFYAWTVMNDLNLAKFYVRMAKKDPKYPDYIDRWEGHFDKEQGRYHAAYEKFMKDFIQNIQANNKELYPLGRAQLNRAVNEWISSEIKKRAVEWHKTHNEYPTIEQLEQAGAFANIELPDWKAVNDDIEGLISGQINPPGQNELDKYIAQSIRTWPDGKLPPGPYDDMNERFKGYVIWREAGPESKSFVTSKLEAAVNMQRLAQAFESDIAEHKKEYGKLPQHLNELGVEELQKRDPFGGEWGIDPNTGKITNSSIPDVLELKNLPEDF